MIVSQYELKSLFPPKPSIVETANIIKACLEILFGLNFRVRRELEIENKLQIMWENERETIKNWTVYM